jgi:hypothetical protein
MSIAGKKLEAMKLQNLSKCSRKIAGKYFYNCLEENA